MNEEAANVEKKILSEEALDKLEAAVGKAGKVVAENKVALGAMFLGLGVLDVAHKHRHDGRPKRDPGHYDTADSVAIGVSSAAVLKFGLGLTTQRSAAIGFGIGAVMGTLFESRRSKRDMGKAAVAQTAAAVAGYKVALASRKWTTSGLNTLQDMLARNPQLLKSGWKESVSSGLSSMIKGDFTHLMVGAAAVPVAHSIMVRAIAKAQRYQSFHSQSVMNHGMLPRTGGTNQRNMAGPVALDNKPSGSLNIQGNLTETMNQDQYTSGVLS